MRNTRPEKKSFTKPAKRSFRKSDDKSSAKPGERSFRKSDDKSFEKPAKRSFGRSEDKSFDKPAKRSFGRSEDKSFDKPAKRSFGRSEDKSYDKPAKRSFGRSEDKSFDKPERKNFSKPGKKSFSRSKGKPGREALPERKDGERLNKYVANAGICSRREADVLIANGAITVNGKIVTELGTRVLSGDIVKYDGQRLNNEKKVYVLLNKPKDYITTVDDPQERKTVLQILGNSFKERLYPVGRLDRNTTGLLLLTNDGELTKRLTHPAHRVKKIYHATLDKAITKNDILAIAAGVQLDGYFIKPDSIAFASPDSKKEVGIEIHSGQNRVVRRIFEHFGYKVTKLDRVIFAGLTKKDIPRGKWRQLSDKEVSYLKMH